MQDLQVHAACMVLYLGLYYLFICSFDKSNNNGNNTNNNIDNLRCID